MADGAQEERKARGGALPIALAVAVAVGLLVAGRWLRVEQTQRAAFPAAEGRIELAALGAPAVVRRDARGIPHVDARSEADAWAALGFAQAQDRLAQMLWMRRLAQGRIAELIGEDGLPHDRFARTLGFQRLAEAQFARLAPETAAVLERYAAGVEARIARVRSGHSAPPTELRRLRVDPASIEAWRPEDCLALLKLIAWGSGSSLESSVVLDDLIERLGGVGARPFEPQGHAPGGVSVAFAMPDAAPAASNAQSGPSGPPVDTRVPTLFGSSAWVLSGEHTENGAPILAADLHLSPTVPPLVHVAHLRGGELDVGGAMVPGIPVVWAGRNRAVAWSASPAHAVTSNLFQETVRARPVDPLYHDGQRWRKLRERTETIAVRLPGGELREEEWIVRTTQHGPLVHELLRGKREPLSVTWTGARPGDGIGALLSVARAGDAQAVQSALRDHHEPIVAVVYVDTEGQGGVQVAGWLPHRRIPSALAPIPGRLGSFGWHERIEFDELPSQVLEPGGWLIGADSAWSDASSFPLVEWLWRAGALDARLDRLIDLHAARGRVDLRDAIEIQADVVGGRTAGLVEAVAQLAGPVESLSPEVREVLALLQGWEGDEGPGSRGAAVYHVFIEQLTRELFEAPMGADLFARYQALPHTQLGAIAESVVRVAARRRRAAGWSERSRVERAVRESLGRTWVSLSYRLGPSRERWAWGRLHALTFRPFGQDRAVSAEDEGGSSPLGPHAVGGSGRTVGLTGWAGVGGFEVTRASTFRMAVDLAVPDQLVTLLAPGQSEHPGHVHYDDGVAGWLDREPHLLMTGRLVIDRASDGVLVLEPPP